jgi:hypothetical protein
MTFYCLVELTQNNCWNNLNQTCHALVVTSVLIKLVKRGLNAFKFKSNDFLINKNCLILSSFGINVYPHVKGTSRYKFHSICSLPHICNSQISKMSVVCLLKNEPPIIFWNVGLIGIIFFYKNKRKYLFENFNPEVHGSTAKGQTPKIDSGAKSTLPYNFWPFATKNIFL